MDIAPKDVTAAFNMIQGQSTSNITSITQKAALAALKGPQDAVFEMLDEYRTRRDSIHALAHRASRDRVRRSRRAPSICCRTSRDCCRRMAIRDVR